MQKNEKKNERKCKKVLPIYTNYGNIVIVKYRTHRKERTMKTELKNLLQALLMDLGQEYNEELDRAMNKKDKETAMKYIELNDCIDKLMNDISNES